MTDLRRRRFRYGELLGQHLPAAYCRVVYQQRAESENHPRQGWHNGLRLQLRQETAKDHLRHKLTRSGYISQMRPSPLDGSRRPQTVLTTYGSGLYWADLSGSGYYTFVGGSWNSDLGCGPFSADLYYAPSRSATAIGAASCKPLAAAAAKKEEDRRTQVSGNEIS